MMPENRGPQVLGVVISFYILSITTISLRFYTHGVILKHFFAEDYICLAALVFYTAYTVAGILIVRWGLGQHNADVPPEWGPVAIMYRWIISWLYIIISLLTKWIVGLFLLRICPQKRWRQITIWTLLGLVTVFSTIYFFIDIWSCQPIDYLWKSYYPNPPKNGTCNSADYVAIFTYTSALLNVIADFILPILPATLVWKAQIAQREKISIIILLCLGSIASIATIVRIPFAKGMIENPDYLWTTTNLGIWSTLEIGIALTASSLATLKPLMKQIRFFSNFSDLSGSGSAVLVPTRNMGTAREAAIGAGSHSYNTKQAVHPSGAQGGQQWRDRWDKKDSTEVELTDIARETGRISGSDRSQNIDVELGNGGARENNKSFLLGD